MKRTLPAGFVGSSLLLALAGSSCLGAPDVHESQRKDTQREAGSVHMAVLAVAPWSHYADALQPSFELTAEEALQQVIQDSRAAAQSESTAIGLAGRVVQDPEEGERPEEMPMESSSQSALFQAPSTNLDASLRYQAATSLFQEIQLLNRVIRDAAIPAGFRPYLIRLQITLLPRSRHEPYDAYVTLSFFGPQGGEDPTGEAVARAETEESHSPLPFPLRELDFSSAGSGYRGPSVLPLLVSDNLEASLESRSAFSSSSLALSFLGYPGTFASQLNAELFSQGMAAELQARDLNSLLTVGRLAENSLRVRLGAMQEATSDYAMVPRNHNVTLLVMVPEESPATLEILGRVTFVDVESGEALPATEEEELDELLAEVAETNGLTGLEAVDLRQLVALAQANDQPGFFGALEPRIAKGRSSEVNLHAFWVDLVDLMAGGQYFSSSIDLPGHSEHHELSPTFYGQTALALDDGASSTTIELHGAAFDDGAEVSGLLTLFVDGQEIYLPTRVVAQDSGRRSIRFEFPSLQLLGLAPAGQSEMSLTVDWTTDSEVFSVRYSGPVKGVGGS